MPAHDFERPWWWEIVGWDEARKWRWRRQNVVAVHDSGITVTYRPYRPDTDDRCGARKTDPMGNEMACTVVGDHGEVPHLGGPAACFDGVCTCRTTQLVVVSMTIPASALL